jgi:hypothetical protein
MLTKSMGKGSSNESKPWAGGVGVRHWNVEKATARHYCQQQEFVELRWQGLGFAYHNDNGYLARTDMQHLLQLVLLLGGRDGGGTC